MIALVVVWLAPTAAEVLADVQKHYDKVATLSTTFTQVATQSAFGTAKMSTGKLYLAKPDKMRWDYDKPVKPGTKVKGKPKLDKNFIYDGTTLWIVDHGNQQVVESAPRSSALPVAIAFLSGTASLGAINVALDTSSTHGAAGATVLQLTPRQPDALWQSLFLVVDPKDGRVIESIVVQSSGDSNDFTFGAESTAKLDAKLFVFNPKSVPRYKHINVKPP